MFQVCIPLHVVFMDIQMTKIGCVGCAHFFPKSGHIILITQRRLSAAQGSSSFECLNTCAPAHATPTFVTKALQLVAYVQLTVKVMAYTVLACSY